MNAKEAKRLTKSVIASFESSLDVSFELKDLCADIHEECLNGKFSLQMSVIKYPYISSTQDGRVWAKMQQQLKRDGYRVTYETDDGTDMRDAYAFWQVSWK